MHDGAPASGSGHDIEIDEMHWVRVQWAVRFQGAAHLAVVGLRLERGGGGPVPATIPADIDIDGDAVVARFDIMRDRDLMPASPGRWVLLAGRDGPAGGIVRVSGPAGVDPERDGVEFLLTAGLFRAIPAIDPATGELVLDVTLDEEAGRVKAHREGRARVRSWILRPARLLRGGAFGGLFALYRRVVRRNGRRILFTSDSRAELSGNLELVHDRMVERGLDHEYELLTLFKESVTHRRSLRDRFRLPWLLAAVDTIVVDDFQPIIYRIDVDPDVRIVQLWHASGAFKTVGYSRVGKPGGPSPYSRVHKNYTHAIVSSAHDVPVYAEAFGIPEKRVIPTGIPRMDRYFDEAAAAAGRAAALTAYPEIEGRMTILFAPTFRGGGPRSASYDMGRVDFAALHALAVERDAVVIFRRHPFVRKPLSIPEGYRDRIIDGSRSPIDVNDLLFAVDLLITDYSSIVFEYSALGRPMLFYAYDLEAYIESRDFYEPFEAFVPGRIVRTFDELLDAIRREDYQIDKVAAFAARHFAHLDGGSTDRVIDDIILAR